jgi:hypothetical protein
MPKLEINMSFTSLLQNELRKKGYLTIDDVASLCNLHGHYLDLGRRKLEADITPFSLKVNGEKNHIKGWKYLPDEDIDWVKMPVVIPDKKTQEPLLKIDRTFN